MAQNWASERLRLIEELLRSHKRNRLIFIAILSLSLVLLFVCELVYSIGDKTESQLLILK